MSYWLNFAYYLDPNGEPHGSSAGNATAPQGGKCGKKATRTAWLPHSYPDNKNSLRLAPGAITLSQDDFREDQMKVLDGPEMAVQLNYKREVA